MRFVISMVAVLFMLGGCGVQESYVLQSPLDVRVGTDYSQTVSLPVGTRIRRTGYKENVAWIEVEGKSSTSQLRIAGGKPEVWER
jgi:uncharacterized protein YraI